MKRELYHAKERPLPGDVVEIREKREQDGEPFEAESMLRVIAVAEDYVWLKEYGTPGRLTLHLKQWRTRIDDAIRGVLIRPADYDAPF